MLGILGKKIGMSRVINEEGHFVPVTYIQAEPNEVIQVKTLEKDGYNAVSLGVDAYARPRKNKKYKFVREVLVDDSSQYKVGQKISLTDLGEIERATITAYSKGRGFQGGVKRWSFNVARKSHGTKDPRHGSTMNNCITGRSKKGNKMPGRMGNAQITLRDRKIILINTEKNVYAVKGPIPGALNGFIVLKIDSK